MTTKPGVSRASGNGSGGMSEAPASQDPELLRRLLRAKDRMDAASHEAWSVRRLARVSNVSAAHFARSFKEAFGVPPHRYLLTRRIERATALLRDTDLAITEIAFQTGWASLGTFGRIFRDITGESPGAMRERARAAAGNLGSVPHCVLSAAHRPNLTIAVSEKRRRVTRGKKALPKTEGERATPAQKGEPRAANGWSAGTPRVDDERATPAQKEIK
ncbi:MAG: AraC family transcriptional regulator [Gammaproteobacteria bacterium]|nr:AraC family transcriptional regulator [Gammaproteobacteria bacterium]